MYIINFSGYNKLKYGQYSIGHIKLEYSLNYLTSLVQQGWQLDRVQLVCDSHKIELPLEAFDGEYMGQQIEALQDQWETILC